MNYCNTWNRHRPIFGRAVTRRSTSSQVAWATAGSFPSVLISALVADSLRPSSGRSALINECGRGSVAPGRQLRRASIVERAEPSIDVAATKPSSTVEHELFTQDLCQHARVVRGARSLHEATASLA